MSLKRYALFEFDQYYPSGGFNDFQQSFDSAEEAVAYYHLPRPRPDKQYDTFVTDYFQVIDLQTGKVVAED